MNNESEYTKKPLDVNAPAANNEQNIVNDTDATKAIMPDTPDAVDDSERNPFDNYMASAEEEKDNSEVVNEFSMSGNMEEGDIIDSNTSDDDNGSQVKQDDADDIEVIDDTDDRLISPPDYISDMTLASVSQSFEAEEGKTEKADAIDGRGTTKDPEKDISFESNKVSASDAARKPSKKSGPATLNKKFLLTMVMAVFGTIFLVAILVPTNWKKKKDEKETPLGGINLDNIEGYAKKRSLNRVAQTTPKDVGDKNMKDVHSSADEKEPPKHETQYDKDGNVIIPTFTIEDSNPPGPQPYNYTPTATGYSGSGGGSSNSSIPDTRNDRLQGKSIAGIKGLTSSQRSYSTDYDETVEKNTSAPEQIPGMFTLPSKDEFVAGQLNKSLAAYKSMYGENDPYATQNNQSNKQDFYNGAGNKGKLDPVTGVWLGLNTIWQGSIFEAVLTSEINTDLPGEVTARTAKDIYSSQDGRYLLIPQNSVLYGTYNSSISYSQSRVQVVWNTLIRPDGYQIDLGGMNGTDAKGASGLKGLINDHPLAYIKAILLMSAFSAINTEFTEDIADTENQYAQNTMANAQQVSNEMGQKLIDRAMNVQPTIKIKAGTKINIVANQTVSLPPVNLTPVTQQYRRY